MFMVELLSLKAAMNLNKISINCLQKSLKNAHWFKGNCI